MKQQKHVNNQETICPISVIEDIIETNNWAALKLSERDIAFEYESDWGEFHLAFAWTKENKTLSVTAAIDQYQLLPKSSETFELLGLINQRLWLGHFEVSEDGTPFFRYTLLLPESIFEEEARIIEETMDIAISECERFDPVFHFHLSGKDPHAAIEAAMLEPKGEA